MVGMGTPPWYVPDLENERAVYSHLGRIQGNVVQVRLGAIHLQLRLFHHPDEPIYYWLLFSFAGNPPDWQDFDTRKRDVMIWEKIIASWYFSPRFVTEQYSMG